MELEQIMQEPWLPSQETMSLVKSLGEDVSFKKGDLLVEQGRLSHCFFIIKEGLCRSFYSDENYEDTNLFAKDGDIIGSVTSFFDKLPARFSIEALVPTKAIKISFTSLREAMSVNHELSAWVRDLLFGQLNILERRYIYRSARDNSYVRYCLLLENWEHKNIHEVPLKYIAQYLQITPQMLSKIRRKYIKEKSSKRSK